MKKFKFSLRLPKGRNIHIQLAMVFLCLIGLLMIVSASMTTNISTQALMNTALRQIMFISIGYFGYVMLARYFRIEYFKKLSVLLSIVMIFLLIVPRFFGPINGAYAWIQIPGFGTIQPSEFAKLGLIIVFAVYLGDNRKRDISFGDLIQKPALYFIFTFIQFV